MTRAKMSPHTLGAVAQTRISKQPLRLIVRYRSHQDQKEVRARLAGRSLSSVQRDFSLLPFASIQNAPPHEFDSLAELDEVEEIWLDLPVTTALHSALPMVKVPDGRQVGMNDGSGQTICVIDSGIDFAHPDFANRIALSKNFTGAGAAEDGHGHGTHVASIAAGSGAASQGKYAGIAPAASLMVAKVLQDDGTGCISDVMAAIEWAV